MAAALQCDRCRTLYTPKSDKQSGVVKCYPNTESKQELVVKDLCGKCMFKFKTNFRNFMLNLEQ